MCARDGVTPHSSSRSSGRGCRSRVATLAIGPYSNLECSHLIFLAHQESMASRSQLKTGTSIHSSGESNITNRIYRLNLQVDGLSTEVAMYRVDSFDVRRVTRTTIAQSMYFGHLMDLRSVSSRRETKYSTFGASNYVVWVYIAADCVYVRSQTVSGACKYFVAHRNYR